MPGIDVHRGIHDRPRLGCLPYTAAPSSRHQSSRRNSVDIVANVGLLHLMHRTTGVVHAGAESCGLPRTLADFHRDVVEHLPHELHAPPPRFQYIIDKSAKQGRYAGFWKVAEGNWHFSDAKVEEVSGSGMAARDRDG
ncbi:hypothetical protein R3P38DRAFT_3620845 [Favolaschia claudopus]|uniref:Uncharacterized protein n=1 Tax=Favolaschia claudopus TaxID=2862362 RepID=A0AAW0DA20_9AGAR